MPSKIFQVDDFPRTRSGKISELAVKDIIHGKEINHPINSSQNKRIVKVLNNVEKVIANSEYTKNLAINIGVDQARIVVINPGVNPAKQLNKK